MRNTFQSSELALQKIVLKWFGGMKRIKLTVKRKLLSKLEIFCRSSKKKR